MPRIQEMGPASAVAGRTTLEVAVFVGLQASGKTSFFRERLAATHALVSKDLMRNNRRRAARQLELVAEALAGGRSVVVDNTNPAPEDRVALIGLGKSLGARVVAYSFRSPFEDCIVRNAARNARERVPDVALRATISRLVAPSFEEGFDAVLEVTPREGGGFEVVERTR